MPPAQQIKAYVDVQSLPQLTQFHRVSGEQVVRAYHLGPRLKDIISNMLAELAGNRSPVLITGERGTGKSHLLMLIRSLLMRPALASGLRDSQISSAANRLSSDQFFVMELHLTGEEPPDLFSLLREELASREYSPVMFTDDEWEASMMGEGIFRLIRSKLPVGTSIVLFIDGISHPMKASSRLKAQFKRWLLWAAERFRNQNQGLIVTLDQDLLDPELTAAFTIETIEQNSIREIVDKNILKKNDSQRAEIGQLYYEVKQLMPGFPWLREDFVSLFPIHPAVLEVSSCLRAYSKSYSFFGFVTAAASRAMNRRALSLSSLDELFDSFEFDLRKNEVLAEPFAAYDQIIHVGIANLSGFDEKVWAKLALKALFIYSLSGKPVTLNKLADSVMIYDERDPFTAIQKMRAILGCFVSTTPKAIEVSGEGEELGCRFVIGAAKSPNQILEEMASEIDEEDPRLAELLICIGGEYFSDWPLKPDPYTQTLTQRAEIRIPWRGTLRKGILKIGDMVELLPIDPNIGTGIDEDLLAMGMDFESPQSVTESLENDEDDLPEIDVLFDSQTEAPAISAADLEEAPVKVCEWDWQISIVPINGSPPAVAPKYSPVTLFYWQPQRMNAEDARKLKQALVLRTESELFIKHGLNIQAFSDALNAELRMIFHRLYVEGGYLLCPAKQSAIQVSTPESLELEAETQDHLLEELFSELLIEGFANRFPLHPIFGDQLTEYEVLRLTVGLFGALNPSSPVVQSYAEAYGLPFKLVAKVDGEYRLSLDIDDPHPAVAEILQRITDSESGSIAIKDSYVTLRKEPYGLQLPAQRLIIMALIAAWKIELTDESASKSLSASQLSTESEFRHYTIIRKPSISHPPELITAWCGMLTAQEAEADLISPQGRRQVREALQNWRDNWVNLGLVSRIETLPADLLTTRLWQITVSCRRYFEAISSSIAGLLNDEFSVEASISKIIDIFNGKETIYIKAVNELTMLVQYLDWLPYYIETKNYVLAAEKTNDSQINNERRELVDFLSQSNRLLDEEKRQRYEMVYNSFHTRYVDYYCTLHDSMVASQGIKNQLEEIISSQKWRNFEILSQLSVANRSYYATAIDLVRSLRERMCVFPTRELLQTQPFCACSFRINQTVDPATKIEILKVVIDIGTAYHKRLLKHYAPQIKKIGENQNNGEHDARFDKLQKLISDTNGLDIVELSTIEAFNDLTLATPSSIGLFPVVRFGGKSSKDQLRKDFEKWFETLPDDPNLSLEFLDATEEKE